VDSIQAMGWAAATTIGSSLPSGVAAVRRRVDPGIRRSLRALGAVGRGGSDGWADRMFERVGDSRIGSVVWLALRHDRTFRRRLLLAGIPWSPAAATGRTAVTAGCGAGVALAVASIAPPTLILVPLGFLAGRRLPGFALARRARRRQARIEAQVPELVELLVAASESGLPPATAFVRSAEVLAAPLGDELRVAVAETELGAPWRVALDAAVSRTEAPGLASLARSLERSHRLGASVRGALRALVNDLRAERRARAEERARRAPVKMLFPLVFLILPAFLLLTVGPVLLSTVRSLH
jgi:tight adherence protein C